MSETGAGAGLAGEVEAGAAGMVGAEVADGAGVAAVATAQPPASNRQKIWRRFTEAKKPKKSRRAGQSYSRGSEDLPTRKPARQKKLCGKFCFLLRHIQLRPFGEFAVEGAAGDAHEFGGLGAVAAGFDQRRAQ